MDFSSTLQSCKAQIEKQLNWGPSHQWENQEFEELSQTIFKKTGVNLSHTTLKRVWGKVKYDNQPSISTLDALARYLDYPNWSTFKREQETKAEFNFSFKFLSTKKTALFLIILIMLSFSSWYIITSNISYDPELSDNLKFDAAYTSQGLPNTVVFSFDASDLRADELIIQQSWDQTKRISVTSDQSKATCVYYYPGYFRSKFVADEIVLKETDVYIETEGWLSTINTAPHPIYLSDNDLIKTDQLKLSKDGLDRLDKHNQPVSFHYYKKEENIDGDNFQFETSIRYSKVNEASACKYAKVVLHFSEGVFLVPFVIPGCVGEANLLVMDNYIPGKKNDLSALGLSLDEWQNISIISAEKELTISIADQTIYSAKYEMEPGYLVGVSYQFDGAGEVDHLVLSNGTHSWNFDQNF